MFFKDNRVGVYKDYVLGQSKFDKLVCMILSSPKSTVDLHFYLYRFFLDPLQTFLR